MTTTQLGQLGARRPAVTGFDAARDAATGGGRAAVVAVSSRSSATVATSRWRRRAARQRRTAGARPVGVGAERGVHRTLAFVIYPAVPARRRGGRAGRTGQPASNRRGPQGPAAGPHAVPERSGTGAVRAPVPDRYGRYRTAGPPVRYRRCPPA